MAVTKEQFDEFVDAVYEWQDDCMGGDSPDDFAPAILDLLYTVNCFIEKYNVDVAGIQEAQAAAVDEAKLVLSKIEGWELVE